MKSSKEEKFVAILRSQSKHAQPNPSFKENLLQEFSVRLGGFERDQEVERRKSYGILFVGLGTFCLLFLVLVISAVFIPSRLSNTNLIGISSDKKIAFQAFKSPFEFSQYLSQSEAMYPEQGIESPRQIPQPLGVEPEPELEPEPAPESLAPGLFSDRYQERVPTQGYRPPDIPVQKREQSPDRVSKTNVQVLGIDEPDIVKVWGKYIYYSSQFDSRETKVIKAFPANDLSLLSRIQAGGELLIQGETLIVFDEESRALYGYDISSPSFSKEIWSIDLQNDATRTQARLYGGKLYLVTKSKINASNPCPFRPLSINSDLFDIPCNNIYHPDSIVPTDVTYSAMMINPANGKIEKTLSFIGSSKDSVIYMSESSLFVAYSFEKDDIQSTQIVKIQLSDFRVVASGEIPGYLLNQFSLDEYQNNLRVATTIEDSNSSSQSINGVYVLNKNLQVIGNVGDLGLGERIYSVRFTGDRAFVVTFKETDPFYVIDLSDSSNPRLKGQLKIPGYSSYLHPLRPNIVLGVGREFGQVKLSLFNVSDPQNPREVSKFLMSEYSSEALTNHRAFLHDPKHQIFFIPGEQGGYVFSYAGNELTRAAVVNLPNVERAVYINDYLYVLGRGEIVVLNENSWKVENRIHLP